jgi:hypothetical protein
VSEAAQPPPFGRVARRRILNFFAECSKGIIM